MSEPVTHAQFYAEMQQMREAMIAGFHDLTEKLSVHARENQAIENRVLIIETERRGEHAAAVKLGTWAGMLGALGLTAAWEGLKHVVGWK